MKCKSISDNISVYFNKIKGKFSFCVILVLIFLFLIYLFPISFASFQPLNSIEIKSEKLNYDEKVPGSWKLTESVKWIKNNEALLTFNLDSTAKNNEKVHDFLLVIDSSLESRVMNDVKSDLKYFVDNLLDSGDNRVELIAFNDSFHILSDMTNDKYEIIERLDTLTSAGGRSYYQALKGVETILSDYKKELNRDCLVILLTGGHQIVNDSLEIVQYQYLKNKYSFLGINAIQYKIQNGIGDDNRLMKISDKQYEALPDSLRRVLLRASETSKDYNKFEINEYLNTDNFCLNEADVFVTQGNVFFDSIDKKLVWNLKDYQTGQKEELKLKLKLKEELIDIEGMYPVSNKIKISSLLDDSSEEILNTTSPVISNTYKVAYNSNVPSGCSVDITPKDEQYFVFDTVGISDVIPKCRGYQFNGWKITTSDINAINDDYFIMPEKDVEIKGTWSKLAIVKSMSGTIKESLTLYKQVQQDYNDPNKYVKKYAGDTSTFKGNEDIYYYYGKATNNNVVFANYCWKIVRTTDTGGVKLLYNGVPNSNGSCNNTGEASQLTAAQMNLSTNKVSFNMNSSSPADVGYMYNVRYEYKGQWMSSSSTLLVGSGFSYSNGNYTLQNTKRVGMADDYNSLSKFHYTCFNTSGTCSTLSYIYYSTSSNVYYINLSGGKSVEAALNEMLYNNVNHESSTIKKVIDYWYLKNMSNFTQYLEDTVWCNNRSSMNFDTSGWNPNGGSVSTLLNFSIASSYLTCQNISDRFTVNIENGNGALTYPVGLITRQEQNMAYDSEYSPLATGNFYWLLSPFGISHSYVTGSYMYELGYYGPGRVDYELGVRPAVSLRSNTVYSSGDGSINSPYIVLTD